MLGYSTHHQMNLHRTYRKIS